MKCGIFAWVCKIHLTILGHYTLNKYYAFLTSLVRSLQIPFFLFYSLKWERMRKGNSPPAPKNETVWIHVGSIFTSGQIKEHDFESVDISSSETQSRLKVEWEKKSGEEKPRGEFSSRAPCFSLTLMSDFSCPFPPPNFVFAPIRLSVASTIYPWVSGNIDTLNKHCAQGTSREISYIKWYFPFKITNGSQIKQRYEPEHFYFLPLHSTSAKRKGKKDSTNNY